MSKSNLRIATKLVHQGKDRDPFTGAATVPVYMASTYHHPKGKPASEFNYARSGNPSRQQVEDAIAILEEGVQGFAFASGMAAIDCCLSLIPANSHIIAPMDLYGGTYRILSAVLPQRAIEVTFVDTADLAAVENAIQQNTRAIFLETPANPLFTVTDIRAIVALAKPKGILTYLDNTFMTPYLQRPLPLGIDIVLHSATKFLAGHTDLVAGLATTANPELAADLRRLQNTLGGVLSPFDSFLLSRGIKTLKVRMDAEQHGAQLIAERLSSHPSVARVFYPGLPDHPGRALHFNQASGPGAVLSFELKDTQSVWRFLENLSLPIVAPSLGGVETIVTHCWSMSHMAIPGPVKEKIGIRETLLRVSVGIEDPEDLWDDLQHGLLE